MYALVALEIQSLIPKPSPDLSFYHSSQIHSRLQPAPPSKRSTCTIGWAVGVKTYRREYASSEFAI
jgi:hypothetical protein